MKRIAVIACVVAMIASMQLVGNAQTKLSHYNTAVLSSIVNKDANTVLTDVVDSAMKNSDGVYYAQIKSANSLDSSIPVVTPKMSLKDIMRIQSSIR